MRSAAYTPVIETAHAAQRMLQLPQLLHWGPHVLLPCVRIPSLADSSVFQQVCMPLTLIWRCAQMQELAACRSCHHRQLAGVLAWQRASQTVQRMKPE